jgi:outer membrane protein assembly factor BamB
MLGSLPVLASADPVCGTTPPSASDWAAYGKDATNSRHQDSGPTSAEVPLLRPIWTFSVADAGGQGDITGTPIVAGGCVFVGTNRGWVLAFDKISGESRWTTQLPAGGGINSTVAFHEGRVFAHVSVEGAPYLVGLDAASGEILWTQQTDDQAGSDAFASPIVIDDPAGDFIFVGVSGDAAQHSGDEEERGFAGSFVLVAADTGALLKRTFTITDEESKAGFGGATISVPPAIDADGFAYAGTSSSYIPQNEHPNNSALIKIDLRRSLDGDPNPGFGAIVDRYKGDTFDAVIPTYSQQPCIELPTEAPPAIVPTGRGVGACGDVDVDFASAPNLLPDGTLIAMQKSGKVHAIRSSDMSALWTQQVAPAQPFGGVSAAFDGHRVIGGAAPPGQLFGIDPLGSLEWVAPIGDVAHYGIPVASANGVAYTVDVRGMLDAFDAATGVPLLTFHLVTNGEPPLSFAGVSVAGDVVYAAVGFQSTGVDAFDLGRGKVVAFAA